MTKLILVLPLLLLGCNKVPEPVIPDIKHEIKLKEISLKERKVELVTADHKSTIAIASRYMGFHERRQRRALQQFIGVDPARIDWCAAFVNSVLAELGIPGSDTVSEWPLTAKSFLRWGQRVSHPEVGDIVILPRGTESWQGHVGFYYGSEYRNGVKFYQILGGNQSNSVTVLLFPAQSVISIRRAPVNLSKNDK
jgi:uncharacterized protein (TIGR02594 family)